MTSTLFLIQKAAAEKGIFTTKIPLTIRAGTANCKKLPAAPARSAAKRSKRGVHIAPTEKVNQAPDTSSGVHLFCGGACEPNPGSGGGASPIARMRILDKPEKPCREPSWAICGVTVSVIIGLSANCRINASWCL